MGMGDQIRIHTKYVVCIHSCILPLACVVLLCLIGNNDIHMIGQVFSILELVSIPMHHLTEHCTKNTI